MAMTFEELMRRYLDERKVIGSRLCGFKAKHLDHFINSHHWDLNLTIFIVAVSNKIKKILHQPQHHVQMMVHILRMLMQTRQRALHLNQVEAASVETLNNFKLACTRHVTKLFSLLNHPDVDLNGLDRQQWKVIIDLYESLSLGVPGLFFKALRLKALR